MQLTNFTFLLLVPLAALVLARIGAAPRRRVFMLVASYAFYAITSAPYLPLLIGVGALAQGVGAWALVADAPRRRRRALSGVAVLVLTLVAVRTPAAAHLIERSSHLVLGHGPVAVIIARAAPLGFSFYVFEAIGYLVEVSKGRERAYLLWDFQLFVAFFPHLLSGPIMRARDLIGQLHMPGGLLPRKRASALALIVWGLFLKLALADQLAPRLDAFFDGKELPLLSPSDAAVIAIGFGVQMYLDFFGYSLIAIGAGLLCGARLVENFNHPFLAQSPADFWNRWHISLSHWIRDYVFLAAVGKSRSLWRLSSAALLAFALCGLWHQWSLKFAVWGLFHGAVIAGYHVYRTLVGARINRALAETSAVVRLFYDGLGWLATTVVLLPGWVLFRAPTFTRAFELLTSFVAIHRPPSLGSPTVVHVLILYSLVVVAPLVGPVLDRGRAWATEAGPREQLLLRVAGGFALGIVVAFILVFWGGHSGFIYLQF